MIHPRVQVSNNVRPDDIELQACLLWLDALARDLSLKANGDVV
jgi:hypothetical protein